MDAVADTPDKAWPMNANDPFPLTDIQQPGTCLDVIPRFRLAGPPASSATNLNAETLDFDAYRAAWEKVIARHPMLRARMLNASSQRRLKKASRALSFRPTTSAQPGRCRGRPSRQSAIALPAPSPRQDTWPMLDVERSLQPSGRIHIHMRFDLLITDQRSILKILGDEVARSSIVIRN